MQGTRSSRYISRVTEAHYTYTLPKKTKKTANARRRNPRLQFAPRFPASDHIFVRKFIAMPYFYNSHGNVNSNNMKGISTHELHNSLYVSSLMQRALG